MMWLSSLQQRDINSCFLAEKETVITWNHFELHSTLLKVWKAYINSHQAWIQTSTEKTAEFCAVMVKQLAPYLCSYLGTQFSKAHCNDSILVLCNLSQGSVKLSMFVSVCHADMHDKRQQNSLIWTVVTNTATLALKLCLHRKLFAWCDHQRTQNVDDIKHWKKKKPLAMQSAHNSTVWHMTW